MVKSPYVHLLGLVAQGVEVDGGGEALHAQARMNDVFDVDLGDWTLSCDVNVKGFQWFAGD